MSAVSSMLEDLALVIARAYDTSDDLSALRCADFLQDLRIQLYQLKCELGLSDG